MEAQIHNTTFWISCTNPKLLIKFFNKALEKSGFTVLKTIEHEFEPAGFTQLWLLAESHFAIHTFPEKQTTYVELSSCNYDKYCNFVGYFLNNKSEL